MTDDIKRAKELAVKWRARNMLEIESESPTITLADEADLQLLTLNKAEAHRLAHKLRDPKFYTARTKRAVNSGGVL